MASRPWTMQPLLLLLSLLLSILCSISSSFPLTYPSHRPFLATSASIIVWKQPSIQEERHHYSNRNQRIPTQAPPSSTRGQSMVLVDDYSDIITTTTNANTTGDTTEAAAATVSERDLSLKYQVDYLQQEIQHQATLFHEQHDHIQQKHVSKIQDIHQSLDNLQQERASFRAWRNDALNHFEQRRAEQVHNATQVYQRRCQQINDELQQVNLKNENTRQEMMDWQCETVRRNLHLEHLHETTNLVRHEVTNLRTQHARDLVKLHAKCQTELADAQNCAKQERVNLTADSTGKLQEAEDALHAIHFQISETRQQLHQYNRRLNEMTAAAVHARNQRSSSSVVGLTCKLIQLLVQRLYQRVVRPLSLVLWTCVVRPILNLPLVQKARHSLRTALHPNNIARVLASSSTWIFYYIARPLGKLAGRIVAMTLTCLWQWTELPRKSLVKQMTFPTVEPAG